MEVEQNGGLVPDDIMIEDDDDEEWEDMSDDDCEIEGKQREHNNINNSSLFLLQKSTNVSINH